MAAGDPISGQNGTLKVSTTEANQVTNWKITKKAGSSKFASNTSGGWKRTVLGSKEWSGSFELKLSVGSPIPVKAGQAYPMTFHIDKTPTDYYVGTAAITQVDTEVDINDGKEITIAVTFEGDGALTFSGTLLAAVEATGGD